MRMKNLFLSNFTRKCVSLLLFSVLFTALPLAAQVAEPYVLPGFAPVQYATGVTEITSAADLNSLPTPGTLTTGWYVLEGTFTYNGTITVSGDVSLILQDGCNVTVNGANAGIDVEGSNSLIIYGQTGSGVLTVHGSGGGAGIGGSGNSGGVGKAGGTITINGGEIHAFGGAGGAGIGGGGGRDGGGVGGTITINGGFVNATGSGVTGSGNDGGGGAGIGGGGGTNTNPPSATSSLGGEGGTININGGSISATGGSEGNSGGGAGIGGGGGTSGGSGGTIIIISGTVDGYGGDGKGGGAGIGGGGGTNSISGSSGGASGSISIVDANSVTGHYGGTQVGSTNFEGANIGSGGDGNSHTGSGTPYTNQYNSLSSYFKINVAQTTGGTIIAVPSGSTGPTVQVLKNSSLTFYIIPDAGYKVDNVEVDGGSIGHPSTYTFTDVQGDHSITATFLPVVSPAVITTVNTNVTAPATGGIPNTTATNGADFVAGTVTWVPGDNPFLANTAYTATVTLTAIGSTFAATLTTATINGQAATVTNNPDGTVTLSYQFPATAPTPPTPPIPPTPPGSRIAPSMSLTASPGATVDDDITLTAKISGAAGDPVPTGKVTFKQGDVELGTADLDGSGVATFVCASPFYAGSGYTYTASYPGDANYYANTATATLDLPVTFYLSDNYLNFIAAGETKPIVVISNAGWSLAADATWATITTANDGSHTMFVTAKPNPAAGQRTMLFTFRAGTIVKTLRATQDGLNATAIQSVDASSVIVYSQNGDAIVKTDAPVQRVAVYDVSGKLLKEVKGGSNLISISGLPKQQVLIVKVTNNELRVTSYKLRVE